MTSTEKIRLIAFIILDCFSQTKLEEIFDEENDSFFYQNIVLPKYCNIFSDKNDSEVYFFTFYKKNSNHTFIDGCKFLDHSFRFSIKINHLSKDYEKEVEGEICGRKFKGHIVFNDTYIYLEYLGCKYTFQTCT